jgi:hypothetical protein
MEDPWALYLDTCFAMHTARISSPAYVFPMYIRRGEMGQVSDKSVRGAKIGA